MASEQSPGVLGTLANSVKNIVTGHPDHSVTIVAQEDGEEDTVVEAAGAAEVTRTEDMQEDTAVIHKEQAAAVVHEEVKPQEVEQVQTVVDKEIHQDHYHTTVVPVKDTKVVPTKHVYQDNEAEREIDHRNNAAKLAAKKEAASIHNEKHIDETTYARDVAPTQKEEHIHHHIHETIQPVIERETIKTKVIHVTNHVHETEHLKDQLHSTTVAPAISMADFEKGLGTENGETLEEVTLLGEEPEIEEAGEDEDEEDEEELAEQLEANGVVGKNGQNGKHGKIGREYYAPKTRSADRETEDVTVAESKKVHRGTKEGSKKRSAPTGIEVELEPAKKVSKLA